MLAKLDASKGTPQCASRPTQGGQGDPCPAGAHGVYTVPTVLIATAEDPIVPAGNTAYYADKLTARGEGGVTPIVGQYYTMPPPDGWTVFARCQGTRRGQLRCRSHHGRRALQLDAELRPAVVNAVSALNRSFNNPPRRASRAPIGSCGHCGRER